MTETLTPAPVITSRIVVAITGASGSIYALDLLTRLHALDSVEVHLVMSPWAVSNIQSETGHSRADVEALADHVHRITDQGAAISSGSFPIDGMVIVPASMKTVAAIWAGYADNLISRAADVTIKEHRRLVIVARETPLSPIHLRNMADLAQMGVVILPPIPAFYTHPRTIADLVAHQSARTLDALGIPQDFAPRWNGQRGVHDD